MASYDRYSKLRSSNSTINIVPLVKIPSRTTDYFETYRKGRSRLDLISYDYYGDASYDWLILMANPNVASLEYQIPDNTVIRIPYPLSSAIQAYENEIDKYITQYGID